jgi:acyl-CoA dehydrogenase
MAGLMRFFIFPRGRTYFAPSDRLGRQIAALMQEPGEPRDRLAAGIYRELHGDNPLGQLQQALELAPAAELIEKQLRVEGVKTGRISALELPAQIDAGLALGIISDSDAAALRDYDRLVMKLVNVDEFGADELGTRGANTSATG